MKIQSDPEQPYIALPLPIVPGSVDFVKYQNLLNRIDQLIQLSGIEEEFGKHAVEQEEKRRKKKLSPKRRTIVERHAWRMLRCNIARSLAQEDYRAFSIHLADSQLLQRFCRYDGPKSPKQTASKSVLHRGATGYGEEILRRVSQRLIEEASRPKGEICREGGLITPINLKTLLADSTCVKLDMHYPTDWVLLRDAVKSLVRAIENIRRHGLFHRMPEPGMLVSRANKLSMQMTQASRRGKAERSTRKSILRKLKKLANVVCRHGERYRKELLERWKETDLREGQMKYIIRRIDNILEKLPTAIFQAHERIIGERKVENEAKILSLYEPHAKVYTRGKAGAEVEFGLQLELGESEDGLITDWELVNGEVLNDTKHIERYLERVKKMPISLKPEVIVTDRGFDCKKNSKLLAEADIESMICPKDPTLLAERLGEKRFMEFQRRRAQTEARVGIMKHCFIGERIVAKGYENQNNHVAWAVLAHNLWVIARLPNRQDDEESQEERELQRA